MVFGFSSEGKTGLLLVCFIGIFTLIILNIVSFFDFSFFFFFGEFTTFTFVFITLKLMTFVFVFVFLYLQYYDFFSLDIVFNLFYIRKRGVRKDVRRDISSFIEKTRDISSKRYYDEDIMSF